MMGLFRAFTMKPKDRVALWLWGGGYIFLFERFYYFYIVPNFAYQGFAYTPGVIRTLVLVLLAFLPLLWMPTHITRPSSLVLWILYLLVYVPSVVVSFHILHLGWPIPSFFIGLLLGLFILTWATWLPRIRLPVVKGPPSAMFWGLIGLWLGGYGFFFKAFGWRGVPGLQDIYTVRLAAREVVARQAGIFGYLLRWFGNVLNPFLLLLGLQQKRAWLIGLAIVGQFLIFSFDATKSTFMSVPYLLGLYILFYWKRWRLPAVTLFQGSAATLLGSPLLDALLGARVAGMYVARRVFYVPGLLTAFYYDYFSTHPHWFWAHTLIGRLIGLWPPTGTSARAPGFLIAEVYFNKPSGNANVNFWADAYANMGNAGVLVVTLLLFLLLWLYDSLSLRHTKAMAFLLLGMPLFALTNSSLLTVLLTHGWMLALLLLWLWPATRRSYGREGAHSGKSP